ncbi:hypothetical protein V9T40_012163 [Parthenolecanium corni]|uniref:LITAF domain-containing protein n=1 Tax=Parthenolecanium corni TaxID=536013 RepID=A0AAN9TJX7_9HEMI
MYPTQMPSAPPTYDEVISGPQVNPPYAPYVNQPYSTQATSGTVVALPLGPNPARIKCPNCHADIRTSIDSQPSCAAHLCCLLLLLIGCCPLSSLPYCMDSLKNVRHSCPNCRIVLGSYQP